MENERRQHEQRPESTPGDGAAAEDGGKRPDAGQIDEVGAILGGATISGDGPTS